MKEKAKGKAQTIRALKLIVKQLSWLDGNLAWLNGQIIYRNRSQNIVPDSSLIARSQRLLNRTRSFWSVAGNVLSKPDHWLSQKRSQLNLAKLLKSVNGGEFRVLIQRARAADPSAIEALTPLLTVEALCVNDLPDSPSFALAIAGKPAQFSLTVLAENPDTPWEARALAFMVLGSIQRRERDFSKAKPLSTEKRGWFERCYYWGLKYGLTAQPTLILCFLRDDEGIDFCKRYLYASESAVYFKLTDSQVNELLAEGTPPGNVVRIVECVAAIDPMADRLFEYREELPTCANANERFKTTRKLRAEREEFLSKLRVTIHSLIKSSGSPAVPLLCCSFVQAMRALAPFGPGLAAVILGVLNDVKQLKGVDQETFLKLMVRHHLKIWIRENTSWAPDKQAVRGSTSALLKPGYELGFMPLLKAMKRYGDAELISEAFAMNQLSLVSAHTWKTPQHLWLTLKIIKELEGQAEFWEYCHLAHAIDSFEKASDAQRAFEPIVQRLKQVEGPMQTHYLICACDSLSTGKREKLEELMFLPPLLDLLIRVSVKVDPRDCPCQTLLRCGMKVARSAGDNSVRWLRSLFHVYASRNEMTAWQLSALEQAVNLCLVLCPRQPESFEPIVSTLCCHRPRFSDELLSRGLKTLKQLPEFHSSLNYLLPASPVRTLKILVLLSLASSYSEAALSSIRELTIRDKRVRPEDAILRSNPQWREILALSPASKPFARLYVRACYVIGKTACPPPGVERILNPDTRLRDEYEYLRKKFGDKPREPKLFKRLVSLKARLESQENDLLLRAPKLLRQVESAAHKAELEAIEYALNKIFRNRLIEITGYAPPEVMLDRFLLNALQLMADISYNKKLLKRLLIAHLTGDTSWRENLPANRKFLETFAEKGMDTKAWLKSHPHRFEIEGLGTVRLKLEEDPLNILEMGNYFDTCLSFGGCYSYSTVANACDLNKRVIYAYDKKGRIIARQLIGVNQEFKLVGFHIYDNLNNSAVAEKVYPAFTQFVDYFASRVGIQLDNQGIIDCLTTTNWYHDGIVAWGSQTVDGQAARLVKRHKELTRAVSV